MADKKRFNMQDAIELIRSSFPEGSRLPEQQPRVKPGRLPRAAFPVRKPLEKKRSAVYFTAFSLP